MDKIKQILLFPIFNILFFLLYYIYQGLVSALISLFSLQNGEIPFDLFFSGLAFIGFFLLFAVNASDRPKNGIQWLNQANRNGWTPEEAFSPIKEIKRGGIALPVYSLLALCPCICYILNGADLGYNTIISELFLPQTFLFKLCGLFSETKISMLISWLLSVLLFAFFSSVINYKARKKWLSTPLTEEEQDWFSEE